MTVKTTLNAKDVDNAYLRIKDVVKETFTIRSLSFSKI